MKDYNKFLKSKKMSIIPTGFNVSKSQINPKLFNFQRDIVIWALKKGKCAVFAGTGLGKTLMQLEWANHVHKHTNGNILILAPLAVNQQTVEEGRKIGIDVNLCRSQEDVKSGINITNYDMLQHFDPNEFVGIILDESSILKSFSGKIRSQIIESFRETPYKLACTATPSPNDHQELTNHAEFLGVMSRTEVLSMFFVHDGGDTSKWRLKSHSKNDFWEWVASWGIMMSKPSDLGYKNGNFDLPPLNIHNIVVENNNYRKVAKTLTDRRNARKDSLENRIKAAADIIKNLNSDGSWIIWCDLNIESKMLSEEIDNVVEITGSHDREYKSKMMLDFSNGNIKKLVTKPKIAGFGMNWQNCNNVIFVGLSDSFEAYYQAIRRCWRFGQIEPVDVYIITSKAEGEVVKNIKRKEKDFEIMLEGMISSTQEITKENIKGTETEKSDYMTDYKHGKNWELFLGDSVEVTKKMEDESIHYIMYSPPFASLYTYSNSERDMGNCKDDKEFIEHFKYLTNHLFRVLKNGRLMSVHVMNLPTSLQHHGYIGIRDFRGDIIRLMESCGFIYHSEVCIWKNPVTDMHRTHALGLLHKQLKKDSCKSRQGIPDYVVTFQKPGDNMEPVEHTNDTFPVYVWQRYASPVWMDINQSDTLQRTSAREEKDEKHICPLQLNVIKRCIELWTNEGDIVYDPFAGIGSVPYEAVLLKRMGVGTELKKSYYDQAVANLRVAEKESKIKTLTLDYFNENAIINKDKSILNQKLNNWS